MSDDKKPQAPAGHPPARTTWRPPTRRTFVAMLAAAAAAIAVREQTPSIESSGVRKIWKGQTRWVGHC